MRRRATPGLLVATVALGGYLAAAAGPASACSSVAFGTQARGHGIKVAQAPGGPWYENAIPPLTDQIRSLTRNLYPGVAGGMVAYVRNTGSESGVPSISIVDLYDTGGAYTEPESEVQPRGDVGDLSASVALTVTYASSLRPLEVPRVVARGTLRDLAARGRVFSAPMPLKPYAARGAELGIWRIGLVVPVVADNRIQGDTARCTFSFGLSESR